MFGAQRRAYQIVNQIDTALDHLGIMTDPYFEYAWIDGPIDFVLANVNKSVPAIVEAPIATATAGAGIPSVATTEASLALVTGSRGDPTYRIGRLPAANQVLTAVKLDESINLAVTLMLKNDYSQLPIMHSERDLKGIISWSSIGVVCHATGFKIVKRHIVK